MAIKQIRLLARGIVVSLSLLAAACAPSPPTPPPTQPPITAAPVAATPVVETPTAEQRADTSACDLDPPAEPVDINMIGWSFPIMDFYAAELEKCSQVENLTVHTTLLASGEAQEQVRLALSSGGDSPYDIVHAANAQVGEWAGVGWMLPLNDLIDTYREEYDLDDIPDQAWDGVTIDGKIYGVPIVGNTLHFIYRLDVFDEYSLYVPETYDDVIALCKAIGLDNLAFDMPFAINLSAGWAWEIEFFQMLRALGGDYLDENNRPIFDSQAGVDAVDKLVEVATACMGADGYSFTLDEQETAMQLGTLPAANMWASRAANMTDPARTKLGNVIGYAPAPRATASGPRAGSAWNDYYMIPARTTKDPDLIFRIIMEAADERSQAAAAQIGMVTRLSSVESGGSYLPAANQTIMEGIGIYGKDPALGVARAKLAEFLPLVGAGEMTAQEALDAAAEAYMSEATARGYVGE